MVTSPRFTKKGQETVMMGRYNTLRKSYDPVQCRQQAFNKQVYGRLYCAEAYMYDQVRKPFQESSRNLNTALLLCSLQMAQFCCAGASTPDKTFKGVISQFRGVQRHQQSKNLQGSSHTSIPTRFTHVTSQHSYLLTGCKPFKGLER